MSPFEHDSDALDMLSKDANGLRLAGSSTLADVAASISLRASYPLLVEACAQDVAQTNGPTTLADSLAFARACPRSGEGVLCELGGSEACAARDPGNHLHAIIDGGPCWRVTRFATAIALVALGAELEVATSDGSRRVSAEDFLAEVEPTSGEPPQRASIAAAMLSTGAAGGFQRLAVSAQGDNATWAICLAAVQRSDGDVRLVLGGVSPRPYRIYNSVEEETMAGGLDEDAIAGLADRALLDAESDPRSAGKVEVAASLLRDAITKIAST